MLAIVYSPFPDMESARTVARRLIEHGLVACVNILESRSMYEWKGRLEDCTEHVLIAKTIPENEATVRSFIRENHPYDVPAILSFTASSNREYEEWVKSQLKKN